MTEITESHIEWAVVDRLRQMLEADGQSKFKVAQSYGCAHELPWAVKSDEFANHTVARFLTTIRDATAHGDSRSAEPHHQIEDSKPILAGFKYFCSESKGKRWEAAIKLSLQDFVRIVSSLDLMYCDALSAQDSDFEDEVSRHLREAAV